MPFYDKEKSRLKMVILTKNGYPNQTVYSPIDQNKKHDKTIMEGMLRRWYAKDIMKTAQVIQFYDNQTGQLIEKIKAQ
ncbi:hypothetical protein [Flavobacterium sp.]|uniref:hypothetical protein n=1 Tax=Flavobacterium sp. TaxID=239 RepID=UPI00391B64AE